ncbi:NAD(P)-dependent dehydrogenase (short-subunit alcohol dehydrogenase family) [Actinoplanes campanulatus]|uniref:NAD(P)-dependent dehydrogenase (Short-subunit alcohol dehydrogenase family) n=1 Tax=Actinoplanes campanulatus TaxID=113559 RepID=A0A7W5AJK4_9ACTN|nr:SDR family oxidoreductase [Actinoplanes campanulatus]MBB3097305.1 NAD(P)-dependent dehydrogenase (short-subunit alcohol dehydrogenase family) [Actinoplanes campanulatus]GGN17147.1 3-oxoacyl-ACP reductase [Actinoplanes campanulatus]GID37512.1 3-oxoacyl-ACP reductase [Actinoplanes campanulatus]
MADQIAIVTGASRGIGFAIAQRFVAQGAKVAITGRDTDALEAAVKELGGPEVALGVAGKGDDPAHRAAVVDTVRERFGPVTTLINNIGINPAYGPLASLDLNAARKMAEVNLIGTLGWIQEALRGGLADTGGSVVNISSVSGVRPAPGIAFYGTTKAALIHLTEELAVELAPKIRVNAVAPAVVKTRFASALYEGREAEVAATYPLKRLGNTDDVAGTVAFLCSPDAAWITGQTIVIDGGLTLTGAVQ